MSPDAAWGLPTSDTYEMSSKRHDLFSAWVRSVYSRSHREAGKPSYAVSFTASNILVNVRHDDIYLIVEGFELKAPILDADRAFLQELAATYRSP